MLRGESRLAIYRLLNQGYFSPSDIVCLGAAYECALEHLRLKDRDDPVTEVVATKIIEIFRTGDHDPKHLCEAALKALGLPSH